MGGPSDVTTSSSSASSQETEKSVQPLTPVVCLKQPPVFKGFSVEDKKQLWSSLISLCEDRFDGLTQKEDLELLLCQALDIPIDPECRKVLDVVTAKACLAKVVAMASRAEQELTLRRVDEKHEIQIVE